MHNLSYQNDKNLGVDVHPWYLMLWLSHFIYTENLSAGSNIRFIKIYVYSQS